MSYGAIRQLLLAGLSDTETLTKAMEQWPDEVKRKHSLIAIHAFAFINANAAYAKAQGEAMNFSVAASQARIHLHNAIVDWQETLEKALAADAVDPAVAEKVETSTREKSSSSSVSGRLATVEEP